MMLPMPAKPDDQLAFDSLDESVRWPQRLIELSDVIEAELLRSGQKGHGIREHVAFHPKLHLVLQFVR